MALYRPKVVPLVPDASLHPLVLMERASGITRKEAAHRLGLSTRQYDRYRSGEATVPYTVALLVEMGALDYHRDPLGPGYRPLMMEERIEQWKKPTPPSASA